MSGDSKSLRILRLPAVLERTGVCRTTIYRMRQRGEFPHPVQLTARAVGWLESDIEAWIKARPKRKV